LYLGAYRLLRLSTPEVLGLKFRAWSSGPEVLGLKFWAWGPGAIEQGRTALLPHASNLRCKRGSYMRWSPVSCVRSRVRAPEWSNCGPPMSSKCRHRRSVTATQREV